MRFRSKARALQDFDGPFRYVYVSISAVVGINLPGDAGDVGVCTFPELGSRAILTRDWDRYAMHIDRSSAIGMLLLTGLGGRPRFGRLSGWLGRAESLAFGETGAFQRRVLREADFSRKTRHKEHASSGCYIVYLADGDLLSPADLHAARRIGDIGFGIDMIDGAAYRKLHRRALHGTSTALSLALTDTTSSPEIRFLTDGVYLTGPSGLVVYAKSISMGAVGVAIASQRFAEAAQTAAAVTPILMKDTKLDSAVDLFVQSQRKSNDNLRAFIAAWSALELLVNRLASVHKARFLALIDSRAPLPGWDKDLKEQPFEGYRMRDRFFSVACVLDLGAAAADAAEFASIKNDRSGYYHTMTVNEKDLPTHKAQRLFRKYLKLALATVDG
jgi:hypothetical protein